jgi:hypothetical protein
MATTLPSALAWLRSCATWSDTLAKASQRSCHVIEPLEAEPLVADGKLGDLGLDAEAAHQRAAGAAQVVWGELDG